MSAPIARRAIVAGRQHWGAKSLWEAGRAPPHVLEWRGRVVLALRGLIDPGTPRLHECLVDVYTPAPEKRRRQDPQAAHLAPSCFEIAGQVEQALALAYPDAAPKFLVPSVTVRRWWAGAEDPEPERTELTSAPLYRSMGWVPAWIDDLALE